MQLAELPTSPRNQPSLTRPHISFTSLSMLAQCERKWAFKYRDGLELTPTPAMSKGSLFHRLWRSWWETGDWENEARYAADEWAAAISSEEMVTEIPAWMSDMHWLMERYAARYASQRNTVEVVGAEVPFMLRLPGKYGWLHGYFDAIFRIEDRIWITELKTMGDWDSLESYAWDPQVTLYYWAAQEMGYEPWGILLDAARTYRWKQPRSVEDSFQQRWMDRNDEHLQMALRDAVAGLERARGLLRGADPLRNVSRDCNYCPFRDPCRAEMAFGPVAVNWED